MTPPPATVTRPSVSPRQRRDVSPGFKNSKVAVVLLAHPFLHTSVMTLVIAVMFFSRK